MKKENDNSKKVQVTKSRMYSLKRFYFLLFALLCLPNLSKAATNKVISAIIDELQTVPVTYGTSTVTEYRLIIFTNNGSDPGISFVNLAGTALPQGTVVSFRNGSLTVIGNEIQLPAFMPSGDIYVRISTAGVGACFNITPPGTTNGIFAELTSDPSPIQTDGMCSLVVDKEALFFILGGPLSVDQKTYDGTTTATFSGGNLSGVNCSDVVGFTASGNFTSANVGVDIPVIATFTLTGPDADKYTLTQPNLVGNIVRKTVNVTVDNLSKCEGDFSVYSGDEFTAVGLLNADVINSLTITCFGDDEHQLSGEYAATGSDPVGVGLDNYSILITHGTLTNVARPTITTTVPDAICDNGFANLGATPSAGSVFWYANEIGGAAIGAGTSYTTPGINTTTSFWAEASNMGCASSDRTEVVATVNDCITQLATGSCGKTLTTLSEALYIDLVPGATNYRYWIQNADIAYSTVAVRNAADNIFRMSWPAANPVKYGGTYTVKVSAYVDGAWQLYGPTCIVITPPTKLNAASCGITVETLADALYSYPVAGATNYRYWVQNAAAGFSTTATRNANDNLFRMSWVNGAQFGTTYTVKVAAFVDGLWSAYGPACNITTAVPATKLSAGSCNANIPAMGTGLFCDAVAGATDYRYQITNAGLGFTKTITRNAPDNLFRMSWVAGVLFNTTYTVKVAALVNGIWGPYGAACTVTTPAALIVNEEVVAEHEESLLSADELALETFPNPSNGTITIRTNKPGDYILTNELGQVIREIKLNTQENYGRNGFESVVNDLDNGVYFISSTSSNKAAPLKVFVIK